MNHAIQINYGTVIELETVKLKSQAGGGAVMGGLIGAATSGKHHRGKHAAEGALAAGLLTALVEKKKANAYSVNLISGATIKVVTEQSGIRAGDCVAVEQGSLTNIRVVSPSFCTHPDQTVNHEPIVHAHIQTEAAECHAAKNMALKASTEEELEVAARKVEIFCGH